MTRRSRPSRHKLTGWLLAFFVALIAGCGAAPKTSVTAVPDGAALTRPDDSLFAHVLEHDVHTNGLLDFNRLVGDTELTDYLRQLALVRTDVFTSRQELLAFWLNAHNAYVLDLLRSNQPLQNVKDLSGFKSTHIAIVGGKRYSLDEIERSVLTRDFREPRAFFALYDGAKSSPALRLEPYQESILSDQLDEQVADFLADSTKNYLDPKSNTLYLSDIFHTYVEEMDRWVGGTLRFVREFAPDPIAAWIDRHPNVSIAYLRYDGTLNATPVEHHNAEPAKRPRPTRRRTSGGIE